MCHTGTFSFRFLIALRSALIVKRPKVPRFVCAIESSHFSVVYYPGHSLWSGHLRSCCDPEKKPLPPPMAPAPAPAGAAPAPSSPSSSLSPPPVPMELHARNRDKLLTSLRQSLGDSGRPLHGFVFLQGGEEQARHDTDHTELFRQESYFAYLFGVTEPGFFGAIVSSLIF
ncbi:hypothetical protein BT93_L3916 [Corymbia citriodora subsp. variegata]|uniref:Aminopeptidase P N-terminal domain-containing protein n=1 Tax=Corymbia citriodora subsp. variegata TaxID=360336 RepID=A0A8T0CGS9_CORYI|nr:hypothetical protein BT93_L3916 [Corymbia citriodora subsp. variegata]